MFTLQILLWSMIFNEASFQKSLEDVRKLITKNDTRNWLKSLEVTKSSSPYCKLCCVNISTYTIGKICGVHTLCKYPNDTIGPSCKGYVNVHFTDIEKGAILDMHNDLRNKVALGLEHRGNSGPQPTASNMRIMVWNEELANIAERWGAQCIFGHDKCRDTVLFPVGQNLARGNLATNNELSLVVEWYDEVIMFDKNEVSSFEMPSAGFHIAGRYTQLVWADTNQLGCSRAIFQQTDAANISYKEHLICNYGPSGNIPNQPVYKIGKPCSYCPQGTTCSIDYLGLCDVMKKGGRIQKLALKSESHTGKYSFTLVFIQFLNIYICLSLFK